MTEYELIQVQHLNIELVSNCLINFVSIMSGYLLANYILGNKLSAVQFAILTMVYTAAMAMIIIANYNGFMEWFSAEQVLLTMDRTWPALHRGGNVVVPVSFTYLAAYFGSLYFAYTTRRQSN